MAAHTTTRALLEEVWKSLAAWLGTDYLCHLGDRALDNAKLPGIRVGVNLGTVTPLQQRGGETIDVKVPVIVWVYSQLRVQVSEIDDREAYANDNALLFVYDVRDAIVSYLHNRRVVDGWLLKFVSSGSISEFEEQGQDAVIRLEFTVDVALAPNRHPGAPPEHGEQPPGFPDVSSSGPPLKSITLHVNDETRVIEVGDADSD